MLSLDCAISLDSKTRNVDGLENEMDQLPRFSWRNAWFADSCSDNSQSVSVGAGLISFRFTHPSKFSIAIKRRERQGLHSRRWSKKGKGNGHWPGAVRRGCEGDGAKRGMRRTRVTTAGLFSVDARTPSLKQYPRPCTRSKSETAAGETVEKGEDGWKSGRRELRVAVTLF